MPIYDYTCPACTQESEELTKYNAKGELLPVKCGTCGCTMNRKPNLTSFPGMQVGKHHYGGGQTVMKRKSQGPMVKNRQQNE